MRSSSPPPRDRPRSSRMRSDRSRSLSRDRSRLRQSQSQSQRRRSRSAASPSPSPKGTRRNTDKEADGRDLRRNKRSTSGGGRPKAKRDYASPSPPPASKKQASTLKMTIGDSGKKRKIKEVASHDSVFDEDRDGRSYPAQGSRTKAGSAGKDIFTGREYDIVDSKELRKIQIDIRRSIPNARVSTSPIRRRLTEAKTVFVSRAKGEGKKRIFDRDEIKNFKPSEAPTAVAAAAAAGSEKRSINLVSSDKRVRSRSPRGKRNRRDSSSNIRRDHDGGTSVKDRLGLKRDGGNRSREASPDYGRRPRLDGDDARNRLNRGRGGQGDHDTNRVLDREGLESMRPDIKPWDINPEYVPKGGNYYEHDDREDDFGGGGSVDGEFGNRSWRGGSSFRGRGGRGSGGGRLGSSGDRFCSSGDRFGSSGDRFGSSGDRFGSSGDRFGSSGDRFGSSGDRFGSSGDRGVRGDYRGGRGRGFNGSGGRDDYANRRRLPDRMKHRADSPFEWKHDLFDEADKAVEGGNGNGEADTAMD